MTKAEPLVSVIMNCLNGEEYLKEAIDSVCAQTYQNWEIVFYDNGSVDESARIAQAYDGRLRYFRGEHTIQLGAARNAALSHANGDLLAFLDTDDKWLPTKLEDQVELMKMQPNAGLCYSNVFILNASSGRMRLAYRLLQPSGDVFASFLRYYPLNLQTVMVRKVALTKMSELFDPTLEVSEEYDVFMRVLHKTRAIYLDKPTAIYRIHSKMASLRKRELYPVENEYILNKLSKMIPGLEALYPKEIRYLRAKIGYWHAVAAMAKGDKLSARSWLSQHKSVSWEFMVLFIATFFPVPIWRYLLSARTSLGAG